MRGKHGKHGRATILHSTVTRLPAVVDVVEVKGEHRQPWLTQRAVVVERYNELVKVDSAGILKGRTENVFEGTCRGSRVDEDVRRYEGE